MKYLYIVAIALSLAFGGPAVAAEDQTTGQAASIAALLGKTDSGSGTPFDRLVGASAAQKAAVLDHGKAAATVETTKAELAPAAETLKKLEASLAALPAVDMRDKGVREIEGALTRAIESARKIVAPLATAAEKATKAASSEAAALKQAECELETAITAWQAAVMAPATAQVVEMASKIATVTAERDRATTAKLELEALRAKQVEFCSRNPMTSLCLGQASQTGG